MLKKRPQVKYLTITAEEAGQRIDNFLLSQLKGLPKSRLYRLLRKGEIRVNKKRIEALYRLKDNDIVRLPPIFLAEKAKQVPASQDTLSHLADRILFEDDKLLIINKPSGMSVHAGSTVRIGVIEALRQLFPQLKHLELAHRLDSETSGCLILAKKRSVLKEIHALLREGKVKKIYWALTKGVWQKNDLEVNLSLKKEYVEGGKHVVLVNEAGKSALTHFHQKERFGKKASLMEVDLFTGRTHQIRVHAAHVMHPIAGDDRYGDAEFNKFMRQLGLKRMFLHARSVEFYLPSLDRHVKVEAPLDKNLISCLDKLKHTK